MGHATISTIQIYAKVVDETFPGSSPDNFVQIEALKTHALSLRIAGFSTLKRSSTG
jgi:hypothetical protein